MHVCSMSLSSEIARNITEIHGVSAPSELVITMRYWKGLSIRNKINKCDVLVRKKMKVGRTLLQASRQGTIRKSMLRRMISSG